MKHLLILFLSIQLVFLHGQTLEQDSLILVEIYNQTDGANWTKSTNWLEGPLSTWLGVEVLSDRVVTLELDRFGLKDSLPESLYDLTALKVLEINESGVYFKFDDRIANWPELSTFNLAFGDFLGTYSDFCVLDNLSTFVVQSVEFDGDLPECFKDKELTRLQLRRVSVDDTAFPEWVCEIKTLNSLAFTQTNMSGPLPTCLCESEIEFIVLSDNEFTGQIPGCLNQNDNRTQIMLDGNNFEGEFPHQIIQSRLNILLISDNELTGNVEDWTGDFTSLIRMDINGNNFDGTFDASILNKPQVLILDLSENKFSQMIGFEDFSRLNRVYVDGNNLNFDDLENIIQSPNNSFRYSPQDSTDTKETLVIKEGESTTIAMTAGGMITTYQWFHNGQEIVGETSAELQLTDVVGADYGIYHCEAQHDSFPDLTLIRHEVEVKMPTATSVIHDLDWKRVFNQTSNTINYLTPSNFDDVDFMGVADMSGHYISSSMSRNPGNLEIKLHTEPKPGVYNVCFRIENVLVYDRLVLMQID